MNSAENVLRDQWNAVRTQALAELYEADQNLYRIAIIYSGQLSLDQLKNDMAPMIETFRRYPYDVLDDPRSVAVDNNW